MSIDVSVVIWTILGFLVLMVLLERILYRPILEILDRRREKIAAGLAAQRQAEHALEERRTQHARDLEGIRREETERAREQIASVDQALDKALDEREFERETRRASEESKSSEDRVRLTKELEDQIPKYMALLASRLVEGTEEGRPS